MDQSMVLSPHRRGFWVRGRQMATMVSSRANLPQNVPNIAQFGKKEQLWIRQQSQFWLVKIDLF